MKYDDYFWGMASVSYPAIPEKWGYEKFDPHDGNDVLIVINVVAERFRINDNLLCTYFEKLIRERLPSTIYSREDAVTWLRKIYKIL
jgi:hypothetical protein